MTNSTDNNGGQGPQDPTSTGQNPQASAPAKRAKSKGPIRFEAIVPVLILSAATFFYFSHFFDRHLRYGLEWAAGYVHGAEVNIGSLRTSFLGGHLTIGRIQVTDKEQPERNLIQVERVRFHLLWDALLRAKFVVEEASVTNIQMHVPRRRPGWVRPPSESDSSLMKELEAELIQTLREEHNENILGDIAAIAGGTRAGDQLKLIEEELKSLIRIEELEKELKEKQAQWKQRLRDLPHGREIEALAKQIGDLKLDLRQPQELARNLKEGERLYKEIEQKIREIDRAQRELNSDVRGFEGAFQELEAMVRQDLRDLEARFNIPGIDAAALSTGLFLGMFEDTLLTLNRYMNVALQYIPPGLAPGEKKEEKVFVPPPRSEGQTYSFPTPKGYPLFWLKRAAISSEPTDSEFSGRVAGELTHLTSHPVQLGRPTELKIEGDFPHQQILGFKTHMVLDHTTAEPQQNLSVSVASYPMRPLRLAQSRDIRLTMNESTGQWQLTAELKNGEINVRSYNEFTNLDFDLDTPEPLLQEILRGVFSDLQMLNVDARASGRWSRPRLNLRSNLGEALSQGFARQIQAQIDRARAELRRQVDERVNAERAKLEAEYNRIRSEITQLVESQKKEAQAAQKRAEQQLKQRQQSETQQLRQEGERAIQDLRRRLGR